MANYVTPTSDKKKQTAFLLCLFGGFLGLHNFYVGRIGRGILYLLTLGLFLFGWMTDLMKIAPGAVRDNVGVPLRK